MAVDHRADEVEDKQDSSRYSLDRNSNTLADLSHHIAGVVAARTEALKIFLSSGVCAPLRSTACFRWPQDSSDKGLVKRCGKFLIWYAKFLEECKHDRAARRAELRCAETLTCFEALFSLKTRGKRGLFWVCRKL